MPLLRTQTLAALVREHAAAGNAVTVLTARVPDPTGYGRIVRDDGGALTEIVEHADATAAQRAIDEINSGCYAFDGALLADAIKRVPPATRRARSTSPTWWPSCAVTATRRARCWPPIRRRSRA